MTKNGLFLVSIGFLIILFSVNRETLAYDLLSFTTGLFLVITGGIVFFRGNKKEKKQSRSEKDKVKNNGN